MTPEYLYDDVVKQLAGILGGISFRADELNYQYDIYYKMPEVIEIAPEDISSLNENDHTTITNGLKVKLFSLTPDLDLYVSLWTEEVIGGYPYGSYDVYGVNVSGCIKHGNDFYYEPGSGAAKVFDYLHTGGGQITSGSGENQNTMCCPLNIVKNFGIKFALVTDYTYGQGVARKGETPAQSVDLLCFIPCQGSINAAGYQSFAHIEDGTFFTSLKEGTYEDWISNPQFIFKGYIDNMQTGMGYVFSCGNLTAFEAGLKNIAPYEGSIIKKGSADDPSQEIDPSAPGGGGGNMDPSSDPIPFPGLPVGGALLSGAIKAFEVTPTAMTQMFLKLWDRSIFDIGTFQKLVEAPLDSLIQLQCVPMDPHTSGTGHIMLGNFDTEAVADVIDQEYYTIDCGTLTVEEYWGSALDYSPYTSAEIWVPMVGFRDLDINDIMGKTIHLKYNYSIFDGNLTAQLMCGNAVLYKWPGNVKEVIPVTAKVNDALQRVVSGAMGVATAGTGAGMAAAAIGAAVNVAMAKTHVSRTGELSGSTGLLDDFAPFLIIHRPIQSLAAGFKSQKGYPSNISSILSACSGYTEVEYIHLTGISGATDTELQEIEQLLKSGVII